MSSATAALSPRRDASRWRPDPATGIVVGSLLLVFAIIGIFVLLCFQGYDRTLDMARMKTQRAADSVAEGTRWIITSALTTLDSVAELAANGTEPPGAAKARFHSASAALHLPFRLAIFDAAGTLVAADSDTTSLPSIAGQPLFAALSGGTAFMLSAQERAPDTGEPAFFIGRRIGGENAFRGVALLILPASLLTALAAPQDLGEGGTISIIRPDGWVVARHPSLAAPLNVSNTRSFRDLIEKDEGTYVSAASPADGVPRIVAFRRVGDLGYVALASMAQATALGGLWNAIWIVSLLLAPIAVVVLGGSLLTAKLLRRSVASGRSLAAALEHNEALFQEIHHRVKNNLQSVNALLRLQPIPPELREEISNRIFAMSAVHEHMYRSRNFSTVSVEDYLHTLIANIGAGYRSELKLVEEIEPLEIHRDLATPLGLIVNEVVANSFKHAFPDGRMGTITVRVKREDDSRARLEIGDDGVGFDPDAPSHGMGRRLVSRFARQLGATMEHRSGAEGSCFRLVFPLDPSGIAT